MIEGTAALVLIILQGIVTLSLIGQIKRLRKDVARLQSLANMRHIRVGQSIQYIPDDSHQRRFHDDHRP